ncbi:MAG TPA: SseB family protein [Cellulomonadaceae bacterium]|nr:SseB family protein [Cellulomonadaceae bacterium]
MNGRELPPTSAFAGDDGRADPTLTAALAGVAGGTGRLVDVVRALAGARLLVPVVAHKEESAHVMDGDLSQAEDSRGSAGIVAIRTPDGRTALPVFSSVATMSAWRADARPVPAEAPRAALSAVEEGWEVMVLDPAGPVQVLIPRPAVWALAQQREWVPAVVADGVDPSVAEAVAGALATIGEVVEVQVTAGGRAEVAVVLTLRAGLRQVELDLVLERVGAAIAAQELISQRVDSLELRLRSA